MQQRILINSYMFVNQIPLCAFRLMIHMTLVVPIIVHDV